MSKRPNNGHQIRLSAEIEGIASDRNSGAAEILRRAGTVFTLLSDCHKQETASISVEDARRTIIETSLALASSQPDMSPLLRLASAAVSAAFEAAGTQQAFNAAKDAAFTFIEKSASNARAAAQHASRLVPAGASVLTHSRSSTVIEALAEARRDGKTFSVFATESRPLLEGRALAQTLAGEGIVVALIADAAASLVIDRVDLILVGADRITPEVAVNKIGTRMIALAARERDVPVYALCDSSKFIAKEYFDRSQIEMRSDELWQDAPPGVTVSNLYFETIPLKSFTGIITEAGALSSLEASRQADDARLERSLEMALKDFGHAGDSGK